MILQYNWLSRIDDIVKFLEGGFENMKSTTIIVALFAILMVLPANAGRPGKDLELSVDKVVYDHGEMVNFIISNTKNSHEYLHAQQMIINALTGEPVVVDGNRCTAPIDILAPQSNFSWDWDQTYDLWVYNPRSNIWVPDEKNGDQIPDGLYEAYFAGNSVRFYVGSPDIPDTYRKSSPDAIATYDTLFFKCADPASILEFSTSAVGPKGGTPGVHKGWYLKVIADKRNYDIRETVHITKINKGKNDIVSGPGYYVTTTDGEFVWAAFWIEIAILVPPDGTLDYTWDQTYQMSTLGPDGEQVESGRYVIHDNKGPGKTHIWIDF
jgi:hypothetical protein